MPWRETCRMDEKLGFVLAWHRGEGPMTALCAAYGISRKTGHDMASVAVETALIHIIRSRNICG